MKIKTQNRNKLGPVITVSRQYGANAIEVAGDLVKLLNRNSGTPWELVTNQVLEEAAQILKVRPEEISHVFGAEEKSLESILLSEFSRSKKIKDSEIKDTIRTVVRRFAEKGNCVIVGRASNIIAMDIERSLHIRICAPDNYCEMRIAKSLKLTPDVAKKVMEKTTKKRKIFLDYFKGDIPEIEVLDAIFHRERMSTVEIAHSTFKIAEMRGIV